MKEPALGARLFFNLPYFDADIDFVKIGGDFTFNMARSIGPRAHFRARWRQGQRLRAPDLESLAFFLVERYCFFAEVGGQVEMTRVYHHPWILDEALIVSHDSSLITSAGLRDPAETPLAHFSSGVNVQVWAPQKV